MKLRAQRRVLVLWNVQFHVGDGRSSTVEQSRGLQRHAKPEGSEAGKRNVLTLGAGIRADSSEEVAPELSAAYE